MKKNNTQSTALLLGIATGLVAVGVLTLQNEKTRKKAKKKLQELQKMGEKSLEGVKEAMKDSFQKMEERVKEIDTENSSQDERKMKLN